MLAGCPTIVSPRQRLRSEASVQLQSCHFKLQEKLGSMSAQRLDLPCSFNRKEVVLPRTQPPRPAALLVERKAVEGTTNFCSSCRSSRNPSHVSSTHAAFSEGKGEINEALWEGERKKKKRFFSEQSTSEESCVNRAKRKRSCSADDDDDYNSSDGERHSFVQLLGSGDFWFPLSAEDPQSMLGITGLPPEISFPASSSAEDERACFDLQEEILPFIHFRNNHPWVESVVTEITDKGDIDVATSQGPKKGKSSSSSTSSESHSYGPRLNEGSPELGNGSQICYSPGGGVRTAGNEGNQGGNLKLQGLEIVSLLVACVEAIESRNLADTNHFLSRLGELASPEGTPIHRVSAYFTEALAVRTAKLWPFIFHISLPRELDLTEDDVATSFRLLNHLSPIPKFIHFTSNEMMLRAFEGKDRVHIIDFDIKQGLQWPALFQSLASRQNPPSHVRITGIGESKQELQDTGDRLARFASAFSLPFEFHPVVDRLEDVRLWMLHVKEQECVAVNCIFQLHKVLYDENGGALRSLLGVIRSTNPAIVLMAEQEAEHNQHRWERRFLNSLQFYSAIFDSIDSSLPLDNPARTRVEEMFAKEIRNIITCEGGDRVERHENFETWKRLMEGGGFRCEGVEEREMLQSRMLLKMFSSDNFSVMKQGEDGGGLTLSWLDQPLYTVSSWKCIHSSSGSSFSQAMS